MANGRRAAGPRGSALIQAVVLDIVQPVLQQNGVDPVGPDLISGGFTSSGQGHSDDDSIADWVSK
jgi:hypothetical protein